MTQEEEKQAAEKLRIAVKQKDLYEKKLLEAGFVIDYSQGSDIVNIVKITTIEL